VTSAFERKATTTRARKRPSSLDGGGLLLLPGPAWRRSTATKGGRRGSSVMCWCAMLGNEAESAAIKRRRRGDFYASLTAIGYGSAYVATAFALHSWAPLSAAAWRGILAMLGLAALQLVIGRNQQSASSTQTTVRGRGRRLAVLSLLGGPFFYACMNIAVAEVGPTVSAFVAGLYAILAAVLAPLVLRERLRPAAVVAFLIALLGTAFLAEISLAPGRFVGIGWGLAAAVSFALFLLLARRWSATYGLTGATVSLGNAVATAMVLSGAVIAFAPATFLPHLLRPEALVALAWLGVVAAGGQVTAVLAVRLIPAERSSAFLLLNPVSATLLAAILLRQVPSPAQLLGGAFVLLGMGLVSGWAGGTWRRVRDALRASISSIRTTGLG
jgi:drug/metabolite transporter (DMT)-like permease